MAAGRSTGRGSALPWLAAGLAVVAVSWFGLSNGLLDRVGAPTQSQTRPQPLPAAGTSSEPDPVSGAGEAGTGFAVPPAGYEEAQAPLGHPPDVPAGKGSYRFMVTQQGDRRPVAYDPCRPVHFVVRAKGAPAGGRSLILEAVGQISAATGLRFVDDGSTRESPSKDRRPYQPRRYPGRWAPVLIAWQTASENPDFASDVAGEAGSSQVEVQGRDTVYVTGQVQLDSTKIGTWLEDGGRTAARTLVMHELGHLVGLDHVKDRAQVMYPRVSPDMPNFGLGDRRGLAALGRGSCAAYL